MPASTEKRRFFVITGMHRSHTSLLGRMLTTAGLKFHSKLVGANRSNPYGHYEDVEFLAMQKSILARHDARWFRNIEQRFHIPDEDRANAKRLIEERYRQLGNGWGFKNPQSTLFLDFWAECDEARFLFIFREPQGVLSSMYRRMGSQIYYRPDACIAMARAYAIYNGKIADFYERHPERSCLISSADLITDPLATLRHAKREIELPIDPGAITGSLVDRGINSSPSTWLERFYASRLASRPDIRAAYRRLLEIWSGPL